MIGNEPVLPIAHFGRGFLQRSGNTLGPSLALNASGGLLPTSRGPAFRSGHVFPITQTTSRGQTFISDDGRATLAIYSGPNENGETPAQVLRRTLARQRSRLTYDRVAPNFFAISARHNNQILYRRCNFRGHRVHCIDLTYPLSEKRAWDYTVTRISRTLRPL